MSRMLKIVFRILLLIIFLVSCATNENKKISNPSKQVEELLKQKKYKEAKEIQSRAVVRDKGWEKRIENVEKCSPYLEACEETTQANIKNCIIDIKNQCPELINYNYPTYFYEKLREKIYSLQDEYEKNKSDEIENQNEQCQKNMKWGYLKEKKCLTCATTIKIDVKKLIGEFDSQSQCEEKRLLDSEQFETDKKCYKRYIGKEITSKVYDLMAMKNNQKLLLKFNKIEDCSQAIKEGFVYLDEDFKGYKISPKGTSDENRIIGDCNQRKIVLCR